MFLEIVIPIATLALGFGLGRVKNTAKLAAVHNELGKIETGATSDIKSVVARIRAKL